MRSTPMSASIARRSSGEFGIYLIGDLLRRFFLDVVFVFDGRQQSVDLCGVVNFDADHPAVAVGIFVDLLGRIVEALVYLGHRTADRHIDLADRLHAFDRAERLRSLKLIPNLW